MTNIPNKSIHEFKLRVHKVNVFTKEKLYRHKQVSDDILNDVSEAVSNDEFTESLDLIDNVDQKTVTDLLNLYTEGTYETTEIHEPQDPDTFSVLFTYGVEFPRYFMIRDRHRHGALKTSELERLTECKAIFKRLMRRLEKAKADVMLKDLGPSVTLTDEEVDSLTYVNLKYRIVGYN